MGCCSPTSDLGRGSGGPCGEVGECDLLADPLPLRGPPRGVIRSDSDRPRFTVIPCACRSLTSTVAFSALAVRQNNEGVRGLTPDPRKPTPWALSLGPGALQRARSSPVPRGRGAHRTCADAEQGRVSHSGRGRARDTHGHFSLPGLRLHFVFSVRSKVATPFG